MATPEYTRYTGPRPHRASSSLGLYFLNFTVAVIALVVIDFILYWQSGYFGLRNRWANAVLIGSLFAMFGVIASRSRALRPKLDGADQPALVELIVPSGPARTQDRAEFTLTLQNYPANRKIRLIKVIREIMGLGIKDAKDLVEASPCYVRVRISEADVDAVKKKLRDTGAEVDIK